MKDGFVLLLFGWLLLSVAFFAITVPAGGTAQNGKIEGGHYFIGQHAKYREVSRTVYIVSAVSTWGWAFYAFLVFVCGGFQPVAENAEKRPHWAVLLFTRLLGTLLASGLIATMSYETLTCITRATGG